MLFLEFFPSPPTLIIPPLSLELLILNPLGLPCFPSFFGRSFSGLRLKNTVGPIARTLFLVLVFVNVGGILLKRSPGPHLIPEKLLSLPVSNRYFLVSSCSDIFVGQIVCKSPHTISLLRVHLIIVFIYFNYFFHFI